MSYRADDGRRYGDRAEAGELDRLRAENKRLRSQDNGLIRLLSAMLSQCEGQLREARGESLEAAHQLQDAFEDIERLEAERDEWKARAQELGDQLHADANEAQLNYLRAEVHRFQRDEEGRMRRRAERWAVQGYLLMREIDELLGDAPFTSWDDLRYVLRRYREGRL